MIDARRTILLLTLGLCLLAGPGWGAYEELPILDQVSTIDDYLRFAALNNPGLE